MTEEFQNLGKVIADAIIFTYIYLAVIVVVSILLIVLVIRYIIKKKNMCNDVNVKKKYVPLRISIIVVIAALILLLSPIIMGIFL